MWIKHRDVNLGINLDLVETQRIDFDTFCQIVALHKERADLFMLLEKTKNKAFMKIIFNQLTELSFELQMLWGFEPDQRYHHSWMWPQCKCPYSDNRHMPLGLQWVSSECPLHGDILKEPKKG